MIKTFCPQSGRARRDLKDPCASILYLKILGHRDEMSDLAEDRAKIKNIYS